MGNSKAKSSRASVVVINGYGTHVGRCPLSYLAFLRSVPRRLFPVLGVPLSRSSSLSPPSSSRILRLSTREKSRRSCNLKAVYSDGFISQGTVERSGIWSVRDDLAVPSSPYFPVNARGPSGPPLMVQERFMSVISQLFQYRIIRCGGAVDDDMANIIVAQLLYLDAVNPKKANEMLHHKANLSGYLAYHTGQSLDTINQDTDRDFFMSAKEAKEYGLIDGVIMNPLKALQPLSAAPVEVEVEPPS